MRELQVADTAMRPSFRGLRLGGKTVQALEMMANEGVSLAEASKVVGIRKANLERAFDIPDVRVAYNKLIRHIRDNAAQEAYLRIVELSKNADSEHVRADCNKWLAGVDGIAPVKRVESKYHHTHQFGGFQYDDEPIDVPVASEEDSTCTPS